MKNEMMTNKFMKCTAIFVHAIALVCLCAASAFAQQTTGNVRGIVRDQIGAVVTGATVTISTLR